MKISLIVFLIPALSASLSAVPVVQPQVSFTKGSGPSWNADFAGVGKRTYFVQWSHDLVNWQYLPIMAFDDGLKTYAITTNGADKYFLRLKYVDASWVNSLQETKDADFDGDGIPNYFEIATVGSDPFDKTVQEAMKRATDLPMVGSFSISGVWESRTPMRHRNPMD